MEANQIKHIKNTTKIIKHIVIKNVLKIELTNIRNRKILVKIFASTINHTVQTQEFLVHHLPPLSY